MFELFGEPAFWASIALLIGMELALGVDNIVFVSALAGGVREDQRKHVLRIGMALAALMRLLLLAGVVWILGFERIAFTLGDWSPSWRQLVLLFGGLFLVYKAVSELYLLLEERSEQSASKTAVHATENGAAVTIVQIAIANAVFSVDSIITAIGISPYVEAMAIAVIVSVAILYFATETISGFIARHPSVKGFALALLLVIGAVLVSEGLGMEVARPYLYGAFAFGMLVLAAIKLARRQPRSMPRAVPATIVPERNEPVIDIPERIAEPQAREPYAPAETPPQTVDEVVVEELEEPEPEVSPQPEAEDPLPEPATLEAPEPPVEEMPTEPATRVGAAATRVPKSARPRPHVRRKLMRQTKPKRKRDV